MRRTRGQARADPEFLELKNMVAFFRVSELQTLLTYANVNKVGKKIELQNRAFDLIKTRLPELKAKIKEIYELAQNPNSRNATSSPIPIDEPVIAPVSSSSCATVRPTSVVQPTLAEHYGRQMAHPSPAIIYPRNMSGYPNCPDVRLKPLAFYDVLATLVRPSTLLPSSGMKQQEITFPLHLTPSQVAEISSNRTYTNDETLIQVQLRFCLMETSCEQDDHFPPGVNVRVNNKPVILPNPIPTNKPGVEPKRPPRPVNITEQVRRSATVTNTIQVQWTTEYNRGYVVACYLVRKLSSQDLLNRLKIKGPKPAEYTRGLIKEKLREDADCEIATTMLKVSLNCPLGKMRMTTPCRASTCEHLQCFDASLYLLMNEKKPTWNCPVCDKAARYENLVIDGYFQQVLGSKMLSLDDSEIQLLKDGSWTTHKGKGDTMSLDTPQKSAPSSKVEVISDDLEVIAMDPPKTGIKIINTKSGTKRPAADTVDLTVSDDSDEDDIPLKRLMTVPSNSSSKNGKDKESTILIDSPSPPSTPVPTVSSTVNAKSGKGTAPVSVITSAKSKPLGEISSTTSDSSVEPVSSSHKRNKGGREMMTVDIEPDTVLLPAESEQPSSYPESLLESDPLCMGGFQSIDYERFLTPEKIPQIVARDSSSSASNTSEDD